MNNSEGRTFDYLPKIKNVSGPMRDMQAASSSLIAEIEAKGLADIHTVADIPSVPLPDTYFQDKSDSKSRKVLSGLSEDGQKTVLYITQLWKEHRGYESDTVACDVYPELYPGAQSFAALVNRFGEVVDQLPKDDQGAIYELYTLSVAHGTPEVIRELLP